MNTIKLFFFSLITTLTITVLASPYPGYQVLTVQPEASKKTTWQRVKENKTRTFCGGFLLWAASAGPILFIQKIEDPNMPPIEAKDIAATLVCGSIAYWLLRPIIFDLNNTQEVIVEKKDTILIQQ